MKKDELKIKYDKIIVKGFESTLCHLLNIRDIDERFDGVISSIDIEIVHIISENNIKLINEIREYIENIK